MREFDTAMEMVRDEANTCFPEGEYTIKTLQWCDDDFEITAQWGFGQTDEENNCLREEIVATPHSFEWRIVEVTEYERETTHQTESIE